jgi:hypothetical protein
MKIVPLLVVVLLLCAYASSAKENELPAAKAEELYIDGYLLYTKGECENASISATRSKALFSKENDVAGVFKAETLLYQIDDCLNKTGEAEALMLETARYYRVADYDNASLALQKAAGIYAKIKNQDSTDKCELYLRKISERASAKKQADMLFDKAQVDYRQRKYDNALNEAEAAKEVYLELNYTPGINQSNALLARISKEEPRCIGCRPPSCFGNAGTLIALSVLVLFPAVFFLLLNYFTDQFGLFKSRTRRAVVSLIVCIPSSFAFVILAAFISWYLEKWFFDGSCSILPMSNQVFFLWLTQWPLLAVAAAIYYKLKKK